MTRHLDDQEMTAAVAELELAPERAEHLGSCLDCSRQVAVLARLIERRRAEMTAGEPDWEVTSAAVLARIAGSTGESPAPQRVRWWRPLAAAAATVLVAVAVVLLSPGERGQAPARSELPVDEILAEVDAVLDDDSIPGFEAIDPGLDMLEGYAANGAS
jgi:hypothetical protein